MADLTQPFSESKVNYERGGRVAAVIARLGNQRGPAKNYRTPIFPQEVSWANVPQ